MKINSYGSRPWWRAWLAATLTAALWCTTMPLSQAGNIVDQWSQVEPPPPPALRSVAVHRGSTALLVMDLNKTVCSAAVRPRCVATLPAIAKLVRRARASGVFVLFTIYGHQTRKDIAGVLGVRASDHILRGMGPDKFMGTNLAALLKARHINTLITVGTAAEGAVLSTAAGAALRGFQVIVPVDGMSSSTLYGEQATAWYLAHAPLISQHAVLTTVGSIKF